MNFLIILNKILRNAQINLILHKLFNLLHLPIHFLLNQLNLYILLLLPNSLPKNPSQLLLLQHLLPNPRIHKNLNHQFPQIILIQIILNLINLLFKTQKSAFILQIYHLICRCSILILQFLTYNLVLEPITFFLLLLYMLVFLMFFCLEL